MSTASTTWNSSWASSRKTTREKACPKRMFCLWTLFLNLLDTWPGRTQTSRRRSTFSPSLLITALTTRKIVTCGFWSQLVSIEVGEYRYSTRLNSSRRYSSTIFCLWIVRSSKKEDKKRKRKKRRKKDRKTTKVKRTNRKIKTRIKIKLNKKKKQRNRANKAISRRCLLQKN